MLVARACRAGAIAPWISAPLSARRTFTSSPLVRSDSVPPTSSTPPSSAPRPDDATSSQPRPSRPIDVSRLQVKLNEARHTAQLKLKTFLATLDTNAKKRRKALSAAVEAWELERKLRHVGGKINEATGYEEIERLRISVGDKERSLLDVRSKALNLKKEYAARVKLRADSQREVNDLLQRKGSWNSADVLRFTELVQQDHENEQAEVRAKLEMEAGDEEAEKGFQEFMQAILERYHEEQVWSDKIRAISTYGSLAITSLNVLLFIVTLLLIEPWRRRRLVENVEERLRTNSQQSHEATLAQLVSLQNLFSEAQAKLEHLTTLATAPAASPVEAEVSPAPLLDDSPAPEHELAAALEEPAAVSDIDTQGSTIRRQQLSLEEVRTLDDAWTLTRETVEEHETLAAAVAGAVGALVLSGLLSALAR
ncbi:hypothetical protein JCM3766R1_006288 [Sporobolomyces carnicolor]